MSGGAPKYDIGHSLGDRRMFLSYNVSKNRGEEHPVVQNPGSHISPLITVDGVRIRGLRCCVYEQTVPHITSGRPARRCHAGSA